MKSVCKIGLSFHDTSNCKNMGNPFKGKFANMSTSLIDNWFINIVHRFLVFSISI